MEPKVGSTLVSTVDDTAVVVVRWSAGAAPLTCGGAPMVGKDDHDGSARGTLDPDQASGTVLGKRYVAADGSVELLCTKAGQGSLALGDAALAVKAAKPLPASD
ncbi:hypothetical protein IQ251_02300 [Saccharopolyspora sp. HNM0983]|uniref:Uncharacterized protein n=1 Tax=Saccharopolyspora montiporae TaxID=2781240 RepID=A0A929G058_9PSEU|nr:hypothetical protein [Saccharopolyspora sp. HNM0983]MBE9373268.1 hypothetical protein [Saccharopolyspora sp. HNM0983]